MTDMKKQLGWVDEDTFTCFVPAKMIVVKGGEKGADKSGKRWIQGIASTDGRDLQGEIVQQGGIDFTYFLKHGFFNDDHKPGPDAKVGQPTEAKLTKNGLWVKGFLFKNADPNKKSKADEYWDLMNDIEASQSDRKVGFSIQGKVLRRNGNTIEKCWIQDIAITTQPVNTATWAEIAKSLNAQKWDLVKDKEEEKKETEKALAAAGSPLVPESLEGKEKNVVVTKATLLSFDEACALVKSQTGLTDDESVKSIVSVAFGMFGQE
jgi:hypothetical protein